MNCPTCRHVNPTGQRFCGECGARLDAASAGVIATERSYTPAHLAQKILQSRSALEGERKLVTILFCDIADSTPLAARIGPDRMHKLLNSFFETALAEVHRFEGTVNQFLGDGFMALFGAPIAHEDHARRAALAALAIRKAIASDRQFQARDIALKTRIGLNTGAVVVGGIGDNLRMDYTAIGDTTNVAARIQGVAEPGAILASNAVVRATGEHVEWRPMGLHSLKGKTESIALHELIGERSHRSRSTHRADAALIGRQAELQAIDQCLEQVGAGRGGVLAIVGEAGLGKSRLLEEAARGGAECGLRVLRGSCLSFGRTLSYWSFREMVREGFEIGDADSDATSWGKLDAGMTRLFADGRTSCCPTSVPFSRSPCPRHWRGASARSMACRWGTRSFARPCCCSSAWRRSARPRSCWKTGIGPMRRRPSCCSTCYRWRTGCRCCTFWPLDQNRRVRRHR